MDTPNTATPKLYIGIDIHKRSWKIKTATDLFDGTTLTCPPESRALKSYVDKHYKGYEVYVAYEAGCCGYSDHREFTSYGWHSLVVNPGDIAKTGKSKFMKTDKIDAQLICRELKDQRLQSISIPEVEREHLRCLFRRRVSLVKDIRKIKTRLKMQLLYLGIKIPEGMDTAKWTHEFRNWVKKISLENSTVNYTLSSQMAQYDFTEKQMREVSNELRKYCRQRHKKDYYLLRSVPGIGGIVACGILAELGDLRRFNRFKDLSGYVGFCPTIRQSGDTEKNIGISPRAKHIIRSYFVEAAWQAIRTDPVMQAYYRKHTGKDSKRIIIKVARKLLSRTLAVIKTETPYEIGIVA